ncbi:aldehyde dehydrogenase family protein [Conexibacter woesei]|uniref:Aldehyde Dehydrogenase n=1 Tax=Conexibacter woesei (strain DSM 14684 / CCUG 47730 / CIP 108061 / JCM 11494 / NBRC 100937 / ID131577) TaxID=469383 RepID=D3F7T0_CONWI|nr:aldehyde dehydrogenase family protein [Conexibacter woesei]ADB52824.1 Aldehyde Dehydrogenase [Conexibacter woesei DSM 14684]
MPATDLPHAAPALPDHGAHLIDGVDEPPPLDGGVAEDPNTGLPSHTRRYSAPAQVDAALQAAFAAWGHGSGRWSALPVRERQAALTRLASALDERTDALARLHAEEVGIPIDVARLFAGGLPGLVEEISAAAGATPTDVLSRDGRRVELRRLPWGPAALMASWNAPAFVCVSKLATALATGCPAVLKPSEHTVRSAELLVEALRAAELPAGAAQVVSGDAAVGQQLAASSRIRFISYTGGTGGGRAVARAAIDRMAALQLELSASNPAIVLADADLDTTAFELVRGQTALNGQWCEAPRRTFVPRALHDELVERLAAACGELIAGDARERGVELGPLAYRAHRERVREQLAGIAGAGTVLETLAVPSAGFFVPPTIVSGLPLDAVDEEIFGPILTVHPYDDVEHAIAAANRLDDGLAGYVFGADADAAFDVGTRIHAGEVRVGGVHILDLVPASAQSFWGTSGYGGHGRGDTVAAHLGQRIVGEDDPSLPL